MEGMNEVTPELRLRALSAIPADTYPIPKPRLPGRQWQWARGSTATLLLRSRSLSPGTFPSRCRPRSRFHQGRVKAGFRVLFADHAADGMFPGPHTLHGRRCPIHPDKISEPCAKFDSIPAKIQQAKFLRTMVFKARACECMKCLHVRAVAVLAITIND
jgi:hypothetical protein